jgi:hypothetical protein
MTHKFSKLVYRDSPSGFIAQDKKDGLVAALFVTDAHSCNIAWIPLKPPCNWPVSAQAIRLRLIGAYAWTMDRSVPAPSGALITQDAISRTQQLPKQMLWWKT